MSEHGVEYGREDGPLYETVIQNAVGDEMVLPHHNTTIDFDEYVQQVVNLHFDEDVGTPYWQDAHAQLKDVYGDEFDLREAVADEGYGALRRYLPEADEGAIKTRPIEDFYPQLLSPSDIDESMSSGTTGKQKIMPFGKDVTDAAIGWYDWNLDQWGASSGNWKVAGPAGLYEKHMEGAAKARDAHMFFSPVETRGLKKMFSTRNPLTLLKGIIRMGPTSQVIEEKLETEHIETIASVPRVASDMYDVLEQENTVSSPEDIRTVLVSGAAVTEESVQDLRAKYENANVVPMYATSFTGPAFDTPETDHITYYPMMPLVQLNVVGEDAAEVGYGERGQVEINRIGPDFFWPNQRERETAVREKPVGEFDWDGISGVEPL